ncbi:MAG: hypothetical protein ACKV2T_38010 [Kofleriaceae bacterium]
MKLSWTIEKGDRRVVADLIASTSGHRVVQERLSRNVDGAAPTFNRDEVWRVLIGCLLTTQQKSGPNAPISRVLHATKFPLTLKACKRRDVCGFVESTLTKAGGIRRAPTIAAEVARNLATLDDGGWKQIEAEFTKLLQLRLRSPVANDGVRERSSAEIVDRLLVGFGPKQSRNFWQWLGLTRYEIPIDSRIISWLNETFGLEVSGAGLSSDAYYNFVGDGIRELCAACNVIPCVFDAAVFSAQEPVVDLSTSGARARARSRSPTRA